MSTDPILYDPNLSLQKTQAQVNKLFKQMFGITPLQQRLDDILGEAVELKHFTTVQNIEEEAGDLLLSAIQLCTECGFDLSTVISRGMIKIQDRKTQYESLGRKLRIAIYGGSFSPPHKGHLEVAQLVLDALSYFDEVWFCPVYNSLEGKNLISAEHRIAMLEFYRTVDPRIRVWPYECEHKLGGELQHLIKMMEADEDLKSKYSFHFIMGTDVAKHLPTWPNAEYLRNTIRLVVFERNGYPMDIEDWYMAEQGRHIIFRPEKPMLASSTLIRNAYKEHGLANAVKQVGSLMLPRVLNYIHDHDLYKVW